MSEYYKETDPRTVEPYFSRHMSAMTAESLESKGDIAIELAVRDKEIEQLRELLRICPEGVNLWQRLFDTIRAQKQEIEDLAAWQCVYLDGSGLTSDDGGTSYCRKAKELDALRAEHSNLVDAFTRLMQAFSDDLLKRYCEKHGLDFREFKKGGDAHLEALMNATTGKPPPIKIAFTESRFFDKRKTQA